MSQADSSFERVADFLLRIYAPTTALQYLCAYRRQHPQLRSDDMFTSVVNTIRREVAGYTPKHARPLTPAEVKRLVGDLRRPEQRQIAKMWTTASRFADTNAWKQISWPDESAVQLKMGSWKSDIYGTRKFSKWLDMSNCIHIFRDKDHVTYEQLRDFIKARIADATPHSIRNGAILFCADHHPEQHIACVTGHASKVSIEGLRPYIVAHPNQCGPRISRQLTTELGLAIK